MQFLTQPRTDLTYSDVFLVPSRSEITSRTAVDISAQDGTGSQIPVVAANMNAVTGRRMAETIARRGGLGVLPQDLPLDEVASVTSWIKSRHPIFETPLWVTPQDRVLDVLHLSAKRNHPAVAVIDDPESRTFRGVVLVTDVEGVDHFTSVSELMRAPVMTLGADELPAVSTPMAERADVLSELYQRMHQAQVDYAPVLDGDRLVGVMTLSGVLRSSLYAPGVDDQQRLHVAAAIGVNGDVKGKAEALVESGVDCLVVDTAHGHQQKMLDALSQVSHLKVPVVAGNVVTADGTNDLIDAGADIIKVGVGPGAMCTTRMMTAVGRPQLSAVLECAAAARARGASVWADGGVKHPRDVALALAAGASQVMIGSWFSGTYESPGDMVVDSSGRKYKENFGMASSRAVSARTREDSAYERARKALFEEGISGSKMYIDPDHPSVEDLLDRITSGVRSSMTYAGASTLEEFHERAVFGVQSASGYEEGRAVAQSW
ncbi:GuaB1 family IMP dehydrogenase-related protein [Auritidibacter sp. NML130574]|uniref:GMP reductase n=1 Tax=Auritidibacter TaxID=1160973 RepID=UPI000D732204|nr:MULTISPECIES: GuaB1 family IMP dehydrogenase-related protein [Auritidibacter]AXR73211.1 GuaB1 family IMP dehydrogenase-related protein [Auritidibacter sp. NML130574]WHS35197.1 GuaB1 family IMP dehydrogenase-related protein [Auritidibacter ignavus]